MYRRIGSEDRSEDAVVDAFNKQEVDRRVTWVTIHNYDNKCLGDGKGGG